MSFKTPPPSRTASNSGTIIFDKYVLGRFLGRGSFAKVYHAHSLCDNTAVAIKVIKKPAVFDPRMEPRLIREVSAMRRLNNHPNILNLHEVMATKTKIYLVMELADGGELFTKLSRRGRLSESTSRRYFQQLVSTLHFCHQNGVAHRDLKPQNLLLDGAGNLKVSDFGLSALMDQMKDDVMLQTACGTPAYTAPEVVRGKGYDGAKADAWSCGVILFVLLAGKLPFDPTNLANMYKKICHRDFIFPGWISKSARNVIFRLLDPNPCTRISVEDVLEMKWFRKAAQSHPRNGSGNVSGSGCLWDNDEKSDNDEVGMNAFDIISMSSGLNLSGLFEPDPNRKFTRFTVRGRMREVDERLVRVGGDLGYNVEKGKVKNVVVLVKGKVVLLVRMVEVVTQMELLMVEIKVVCGVVGFEWEEESLKLGLVVHDDLR